MSSFWIDSVKSFPKYDSLQNDIICDVAIIGGGITGLTCGYILSKAGLNICILEKNSLMSKTSGNTTGKITSQHGLFYHYLTHNFSPEYAKSYLEANEQAISNIKNIIDVENINCDFEYQDSYVFSNSPTGDLNIKNENSSLHSIGYNSELVNSSELPYQFSLAIKFPNQAQFHVVKYAKSLCEIIQKNKAKIFENTTVTDVRQIGNEYITYANKHTVKSKYVIMATHYPIKNFPGFHFLKMYQSTSYAIALKTPKELFSGMYISCDEPTISFRQTPFEDSKLLIIAGNDHKTGAENLDLSERYELLENIAKNLYPDYKILYKWNTNDCISLDKLPYVGEFSNLMPNIFIATGFKKWGMTLSNIASNIICDKILNNSNKYEDLFKSTRFKPFKNLDETKNMFITTTKELIFKKFDIPDESINSIKKDEGKIIEYNGTEIGVYKDTNGNIFKVKPFCSHLGCKLSWNNLDKTWDCPCHGSRFDYTGKSLYSPSINDLEKKL